MFMAAEYPDLSTDFWEDENRIGLLWHYVKWFLEVNQVWIMIVVSLFLAVGIVAIILSMFTKDTKEDDEVEYM